VDNVAVGRLGIPCVICQAA